MALVVGCFGCHTAQSAEWGLHRQCHQARPGMYDTPPHPQCADGPRLRHVRNLPLGGWLATREKADQRKNHEDDKKDIGDVGRGPGHPGES
jgi:hypothetical protein